MARITVEDGLKKVSNQYELVMLAAKRARQLIYGEAPLLRDSDNRAVIMALREIAAGKVRRADTEIKPSTESGPSTGSRRK